MSIRWSNQIMARFEEAAREEAAFAAHGRGRGRGRGRAPAPTLPAGHGRGAAPAAQAPQQHQGQAEEEDDEDEEVDEEIEVEQPSQHQQAPPPPPPLPNLVEVMAAQTQWMQRLTQLAEQGVQHRGPHLALQEEGLHRKIKRFIRLKAPMFSYSEDPMDADDWLRVI